MKFYTYQNTDVSDKVRIRDVLIAGVEFVCAMACGLGIVLVLVLVTNVGG